MNQSNTELDGKPEINPFLMAILSSRLEAIIREMTNTVMKASRSAAIKNARDLSCGLLTYDHRLICVEESMPIHISSLELTTKPISAHFSDIKEGDAFFNNCAYTGVTHHADMTLCTPVFIDGEPVFWTMSRSHHADTGAHVETTTDPYAATIYQEGIQIPCMRFQENYQDKDDLIRMCRMKIRVSHIWYGDYRAQVGACRLGEKRLKELAERYGKETIKGFVEAWIDYGRRRAIAAIRQLPAGTWEYQTWHDPIPGVAEGGIPIKAKVTVDPIEGMVTVDLRDNPDCVPGGVNLSEACATGSGRIGVFNNLDSTIPHNEGSASRVKVLLRDGCVVGRPAYPAGTSNATMGVNDRLINAIQCCFTQMGEPHGMAEGGVDFSSGMAIVSGMDDRKGPAFPFINMVLVGLSGGPGLSGHDGWVTYEAPDGGGVLALDSIEVDEAMYPILFESRHIALNSMGCGHWNGAPATLGSYRGLSGFPMTVAYCSDGDKNPSRGVIGGGDAAPASNQKRLTSGDIATLPSFHIDTLQPGETIVFRSNAGGGYGDPTQRDPQRVASDVNRMWLSPDRAEAIYKVGLKRELNGIDYAVDAIKTVQLRGAGQ